MNRFGRLVLAFAMSSLVVVLAVVVVRAHAANSSSQDKAIGIIFCDDFESSDTSAWGSDDCATTLDMPVAVTE